MGFVVWTAMNAPQKKSNTDVPQVVKPQRQMLDDTSVVHVVSQPSQPDEFGTVAAALAHLSGGGVIEISENSEYEISPHRLGNDVKITIRGVAGKRTVLCITTTIEPLFESEETALFIYGGHLTLSDLEVRNRASNEGAGDGNVSGFERTNRGKLN